MARIAIVGAGTTGLFAALVLARDGHDVVVVEKDGRPPAISASTIAGWQRPGTPQALLPHGLVARGRALLRRFAPDVWERIVDAGAVEIALPGLPAAETSDDDALVMTCCRRPLLEEALWRAAEGEARIELRCGTTVRGVSLSTGRGATLDTDHGAIAVGLVVDAGGRRSPVAKWIGAPDAVVEETGIVYYSRYYALRPGAAVPEGPWPWGPRIELPFAFVRVHFADRGVHSITYAVPTFDAELKALRDARAFEAATATMPLFSPWASSDRVTPCSEVLAMGGLQNVLRPLLRDGEAIAPGVVPIGDALCHTNAAYGWGVSMGMEQAVALVEALRETEEPRALGRNFAAKVWPEAQARWALSSEMDRTRVRGWRGEPPLAEDVRARAAGAIGAAATSDPRVGRAFMRVMLMIDPADALLDAALGARAEAALGRRGEVVAGAPMVGRAEMLGAMRASGAG